MWFLHTTFWRSQFGDQCFVFSTHPRDTRLHDTHTKYNSRKYSQTKQGWADRFAKTFSRKPCMFYYCCRRKENGRGRKQFRVLLSSALTRKPPPHHLKNKKPSTANNQRSTYVFFSSRPGRLLHSPRVVSFYILRSTRQTNSYPQRTLQHLHNCC